MKKLITPRLAAFGTAAILSSVLVFHGLILTGIIPYAITWGGRLKSYEQMVQFETVSIVINLMMLAVILIKAGWLKISMKPVIINAALWMMGGLFVMNTVGNMFAVSLLERWIATPLTALLALFSLRLAMARADEMGLRPVVG